MDIKKELQDGLAQAEEARLNAALTSVEQAVQDAVKVAVAALTGQPAPAAPQAQPVAADPTAPLPASTAGDNGTAPAASAAAPESPVMQGLKAAALKSIQRHPFGEPAWFEEVTRRATMLAEYSGRSVDELKVELGEAAQPQQGLTTQQQPANRSGNTPGWLRNILSPDRPAS